MVRFLGVWLVRVVEVDRICVVIACTCREQMLSEMRQAVHKGARFIELRLDYLTDVDDFSRLLDDKPCTLLATVRRSEDGGKWQRGEEARRRAIGDAIRGGFDWVDVETDIADEIPRSGQARRIVSYHDFREVPANLESLHTRMCRQDADVVKIAVRGHTPADNLRVLSLIPNAERPTVAFCMGEIGFPTRLLQAKLGSPFTYASFDQQLAPGMPTFQQLKQLYRYDTIDAHTRIYGVLGDPVGHSLSPLIHNAAYGAMGINALYLPFRVPREELAAALEENERIAVDGYSVTIPHKEAAAALAVTRDDAVEGCKAANTLVRCAAVLGGEGKRPCPPQHSLTSSHGFTAYNTDHTAIRECLREWLPIFGLSPATLAGRTVLVLGAGGVSRAAAHGLKADGAQVIVTNRTAQRAEALAAELGCRFVAWDERNTVASDILINGTSVGMHPHLSDSPMDAHGLRAGLVVFDTVYTPEETRLVQVARERGCHIITGVELFVRQAATQFAHFVGRKPPLELLRETIRQALASRSEGGR